MATETVMNRITEQKLTEPLEEGLQKAVEQAFRSAGPAGQSIENALHGTWLGHPLHPVLTDIPIGAWTVTLVLDLLDASQQDRKYAPGADAALAIGLVGAVGAAITGLADWHKTDGKARKVGLVHGLLNMGASALFATSLALRRQGQQQRPVAQVCSTAGYLMVSYSAYLGGELVYQQKIGVDRANRRPVPKGFVPVMPEVELEEGQMRGVEVEGVKIVLARQRGRIFALGATCSHLKGPLEEGALEEGRIRCPWHGSCFALEDGHVIDGPATYPQPVFAVRVREGQIEVAHRENV